jgi:hypothetical protein
MTVEAIQDLRALNARFIHNFVTNDVASHGALLHDEFLCVQSNGARIDRASYLEAWATGFDPDVIIYWDVRDELITVIDNVALVRATNRQVVRRGGVDVAQMSTYTDTYVLRDGRWTCIQAQISPVAPDQEPDDDTIVSVYLNGVRVR